VRGEGGGLFGEARVEQRLHLVDESGPEAWHQGGGAGSGGRAGARGSTENVGLRRSRRACAMSLRRRAQCESTLWADVTTRRVPTHGRTGGAGRAGERQWPGRRARHVPRRLALGLGLGHGRRELRLDVAGPLVQQAHGALQLARVLRVIGVDVVGGGRVRVRGSGSSGSGRRPVAAAHMGAVGASGGVGAPPADVAAAAQGAQTAEAADAAEGRQSGTGLAVVPPLAGDRAAGRRRVPRTCNKHTPSDHGCRTVPCKQ